jgi:phosphoglycolate phosphatase
LIGDTDHDLEVGLALGVDVILLSDGHQSPERLSALHHTVLHHRGE